jgi:hypothetical protein
MNSMPNKNVSVEIILRERQITIFAWSSSGIGGVSGRVVNVIDFKSLVPHRCGFESRQGLLIVSCEEAAIQLDYGTSVVLLRCPFVHEIMHVRAPRVYLHQ